MKKIVSLCLVFVMGLSLLVGCKTETEPGPVEKEFPLYADDKQMFIGTFTSPMPTQEDYNDCAAAGFNHILQDRSYGVETFEEIIPFCDVAGVKSLLFLNNPPDYSAANYNNYESFSGIMFKDEPNYPMFQDLADQIEDFESHYPDDLFFVNLYPYYAEDVAEGALGTETYEEYIDSFIEIVLNKLSGKKMLSVDYYMLKQSGDETFVDDGWLYNLEVTANAAKNTDIDVHYYVLTHGHGPYRDLQSTADIQFQYYVSMAYGVKAFSAFTYMQIVGSADFANGHALIDVFYDPITATYSCAKNDIYYYVKEANEELLRFDNVYLSFDWQGAMPVLGEGETSNDAFDNLNTPMSKLPDIAEVQASNSAVIGYFQDKDGTNAYMVTNYTPPEDGITNTVQLKFENATRARVYKDGVPEDVELTDGSLTLTLGAGEGNFVIAI